MESIIKEDKTIENFCKLYKDIRVDNVPFMFFVKESKRAQKKKNYPDICFISKVGRKERILLKKRQNRMFKNKTMRQIKAVNCLKIN